MQQDETTTQSTDEIFSVSSTDDTRVMRYLLHNIKGISPVSGGDMQDDLVPEYIPEQPSDEDTVS